MITLRIACALFAVSSWAACAGRSEEGPADAGRRLSLVSVIDLPRWNEGCDSSPDCAELPLIAQCLRFPTTTSTCYVLVGTETPCVAPLRPADKEIVARAGLTHAVRPITCQIDHDPAPCAVWHDGEEISKHPGGWCYSAPEAKPVCVVRDGFAGEIELPLLDLHDSSVFVVCDL